MALMDESAPTPAETPGFEQIMLPHLDAAHNLARWLLRHEQDAEDCVQEAYLLAFKAFTRFRGGDARSWLLAIVRNACYSRMRKGRRAEPVLPFDEAVHGPESTTVAPADFWRRAEVRELLDNALGRLSAEFREVLVLHEIEGLAYREIAATIGAPLGTVMSRLARARGRLEAELRALLKEDVHP